MASEPLTVESLREALGKLGSPVTIQEPMILCSPHPTGVHCEKCGKEVKRVVAGAAAEFLCHSCGNMQCSAEFEARLRAWLEENDIL